MYGDRSPAFQKSHLRHLSPEEKKFKISFCIFVAAAYRFVGPVSGNHALCWSLWLTRGGRDAASQPRRLSKPTPAPAAGRRRGRLSSSRCCPFHKHSQTTKSKKAASAYGSCSTTTGEKRGRCSARNPTNTQTPPQMLGVQPHGKRGQRHQRRSLQLIAEYTEAKYTTRDEHSMGSGATSR